MIILNGFENSNRGLVERLKARCPDREFFWISEAEGADLNPFDAYHKRASFLGRLGDNRAQFSPEEIQSDFIFFLGNYQRHWKRREYESQDLYHKFMLFKRYVRGLFDEERIDGVFLTNVPHEGLDILIYLEARRRGTPVMLCFQTIFPDLFLAVSRIEEVGDMKEPTGNEFLEQARSLIAESEKPPMYMKGWLGRALFKKRWTALARHLVGTIFKQNVSFWIELSRSLSYERWFIGLRTWSVDEMRDTKYVYFPLHLQPEMTTSALGGVYADQILALESLSAALPPGWRIIAKENPKQTPHYRGGPFMERLRRVKNLEMAGWATPSLDLIRHCQMVATVTGTAAWEGLCMGKPAIVFGEAWFKGFEGAHRFSKDIDLQAIITRGVNRPRLEADVARFLKGCEKGVVDIAYQPIVKGYDEAANAVAVVDGVLVPWVESVSIAESPRKGVSFE